MAAQRIGVYLVPGFSIAALSSTTEPLRAANRVCRRQLYSWHLISVDGRPASSNGGFMLRPCVSIDHARDFSLVLVVSSLDTADYSNRRLVGWLHRQARTDCRMGAVGCGTFLLAHAGLLDGYRCAVAWHLAQDFAEEFPLVEVTHDLFCIDRNRLSCVGETAALDMMLALIAEQHGYDTATHVAEQLIHTRIRPPDEGQRMDVQGRYDITDRRMVNAITLMEQNIEHPLPTLGLAHAVGMSPRQLERLFNKKFGRSPSRFYVRLRLKRAQMLLTQSTDSILGIALRCGFTDASHLSKCFREVFHETPAQVRRGKQTLLERAGARP